MAEIELRRYEPAMREEWDRFVKTSRNATFLFMRGYMDYHADRFEDHSIVALRAGKICGLLPANLVVEESGERILQSHGGLTYGGWLLANHHPDAAEMLRIFELLKDYAIAERIDRLDYKPIPGIYAQSPAQEDLYALFRMGATLKERNISCTIDLRHNPGFNKQQRRNLKRASDFDCEITEETDLTDFHKLLTDCLMERHGVSPVHTLEELQMLRDRFPVEIRVFLLREGGKAQAGVCMFDTGRVAHAQYICSTPEARENGLLTMLFHRLIFNDFASKDYFDFGICNEDHGLYLNEGLYRQKSSLGGSAIVYDRYSISFRPL